MSHSADGLIGTTTHHNSHPQQPPMYGTPQYPPAYGGPPYYNPPPYPQPYPLTFPPPTSGPPPAPTIHPAAQPSSGTPSTSAYTLSTSESTTPSYASYGSLPQNNPYFPFPGPPQPIPSPQGQPHAGVNFVQPSPIQQYQNFEQLNTDNPSHQSNNARKKGKNRNNNNPDQEETRTNPSRTNLPGATKTKGTRTPKGEITTNAKGRTTTIFKQTSLVPFAVSMAIILTIAPK
jgi:hypothetical protein